MAIHYPIWEKIEMLDKATNLSESALRKLADVLDCCTFAELKRIAKVVSKFAKGRKD